MMKIASMKLNLFTQNKWFKRALWSMAGLLLAWGVAWLAVPRFVKYQVETLASAQLGRAVTVGVVDFKPWSLELSIFDLAMARAAGGADASSQLFIKRFYIDAELQSLVRLAPVLDAVEVDVTPYLGYLPASLPVSLRSALLSADLKVAFEQSPKVAVKLSGTVQATKGELLSVKSSADARSDDRELLGFDLLKLTLTDVRPLERVAHLAAVELNGAHLNVHRNRAGNLT